MMARAGPNRPKNRWNSRATSPGVHRQKLANIHKPLHFNVNCVYIE
jgi:hypothetical protein